MQKNEEVSSKKITDNQTWNTCPECGHTWHDEVAIPGLLHRTRLCAKCYPKVKEREKKTRRHHSS